MIIAIDGPAASGKGTVGRKLARELGFDFLDTGLLYRAATKRVVERGLSPFNIQQVTDVVARLRMEDTCSRDLRTAEISNLVHYVAEIPQVREILGNLQREFAHRPTSGKCGVVLDGRDIGTVICPDADVKLFITASLYARAKRRYSELRATGQKTSFQAVHRALRRRDQQDASRAISPLRVADDAVVLYTTDMSVDEAFNRSFAIVKAKVHELD
jgi:cytidylate kinase